MPPVPIRSTTQEHLDIDDIRDDLVILKGNSAAMVIQTSSVNFGLLSEAEQDATIYTYAALLNSLTFPIQIVIRSEQKDVTSYINLLAAQELKQTNPLLKSHITSYKQFVAQTVKEGNVLDKKFYIVIPFSHLELGLAATHSVSVDYLIKKALTALKPKRDHLVRQFARLGLRTHQLTTTELINLFFTSYNPHHPHQQFAPTKEYTRPLTQAAIAPRPA